MRLLLIDTCGDAASLALADGPTVLASETLAAKNSSAVILPALRSLLAAQGWTVKQLDAVGVISGPGSFTGMRVGLSVAKGICCATGATLALVSRLAVLARDEAEALAVLDAGRGEFHVRLGARESVCADAALRQLAAGKQVIIAEPKLLETLADLHPEVRSLTAVDSLPLALLLLESGGSDLALADANYVRGEHDLYRSSRTPPLQKAEESAG